jgi:poly-gamma-glutamate capsule biosynthesis protein CapA/YwtB (metallophosphatase superfamily)
MKKSVVLLLLACAVLILTGSATRQTYGPGRRSDPLESRRAIAMVFAGDIMAHDVNYTRRPYSHIYESVRDVLWEADLSFANLEFVFDPDRPASGYPNFNAPVEFAQAAIDGGFNVFSLANNHSFDLGRESIEKSLSVIAAKSSEHRIFFNGVNASPEGYLLPEYFEFQGVRIGFLAVTSFLNKLLTDKHVNVVPFYDPEAEDALVRRIEEAAKRADLFIVSYHGGAEYRRDPLEQKRRLFYRMVDAGADIIWGHHPHVSQPWETVHTREGSKLILYSTGNFISGQTWNVSPYRSAGERDGTGESALYSVEAEIVEGNAVIRRVSALPIFNYKHRTQGMVTRRFDQIGLVEMDSDWELYYRHQLEKLSTSLYDRSSWGFER